MSGFVAVLNTDDTPVDPALMSSLTASLRFRGPDRKQVWIDGSAALGHSLFCTTREARHENQPASLDGSVWIAGCIRIDAREDLVQRLGMQHRLRLAETPDSHLVLQAYRAWGEQCVEHLLGDYSFVLYDSEKRSLFCARDRFGLRQLCYARAGNTLIVSNSIHCIRQHPAVSGRLSRQAIADFLLFGDHRWGDRSLTAFADVKSIEPAHCLVFANGETKTRRYWNVPVDLPLLRYRREQAYSEHFQQVFQTVVSDRLRTPDAVVSLSGGMDSPGIAATIRELQHEKKLTLALHARTVLYDSLHPGDERHHVEQVSQRLALHPQYLDGGSYSLLTPPVQTTCPLELYQPQLWLDLSRVTAPRGRVLLGGDGGDELFAHTTVRHALQHSNPVTTLAALCRLRLLYGHIPSLGTGFTSWKNRWLNPGKTVSSPYPYPDWIHPDLEQELDLQQRWSTFWSQRGGKTCSAGSRHPQIAKALMTPDWNTDDIYMNPGLTLMEHRYPFLDPRLIKLVMSLPALPWLFNKHLLRRAMAGKLPQEVLRRPKTVLGNIQESLVSQARAGQFEQINPTAELLQFIHPEKIAALPGTLRAGTDTYVNLRPLLLNTWLLGLVEQA